MTLRAYLRDTWPGIVAQYLIIGGAAAVGGLIIWGLGCLLGVTW